MFDITDDCLSYEDLIASMGIGIVLKVDDNDYQGDSRVLTYDGRRFGTMIFGWGSCSGCDAFEAAQGSRDELSALRDDMYRQIHWEDSATALVAYIDSKDWSLDYDGDSEAGRAFRARAREILLDIANGRAVDGALGRKAIGQ
jgi:hypothetical protein